MKITSGKKTYLNYRKIMTISLVLTHICFIYTEAWAGVQIKDIKDTFERSTQLNEFFNSTFDKSITNGNSAKDYLLSFPNFDVVKDLSSEKESCEEELPKVLGNKKQFNTELSSDNIEKYCSIQNSVSKLKYDSVSNIGISKDSNFESKFQDTISNLKGTDTLIVIVPGIFGEFIDQTAFAEVFNKKSSFKTKFEEYLQSSSTQSDDFRESKRFLLKNLSLDKGEDDCDKSFLFESRDIKSWMKVASIDDDSQKPLIKVAVFGLEPMSLESLGKQVELATLYSDRLNKFMEVYKKMYSKIPDRVILMGYSRGTPISFEMINILTHKDYRSNDALIERPKCGNKLKNKIKEVYSTAQNWSNSIKAQVSLGGVVYGSALADENVISYLDRKNAPFKIKFIQNLKDLILSLQIITQHDVDMVLNAFKNAGQKVSKDLNTSGLSSEPIKASAESLNMIKPVVDKILTNILAYHNFYNLMKYELKNSKKNLPSDLYSKLDNASDKIKSMNLLSSEITEELLKGNITSLFKVREHLLKFVLNSEDALNSLNDAFQKSADYQLDFMGMQDFTNEMLEKFGYGEIKSTIGDGLKNKNIYTTLKGVNHFIKYFATYFRAAWDGITELSTPSRIAWFKKYGYGLPSTINYYTLIGFLAPESNDENSLYQTGINKGYNISSDQKFLNNSYKDLVAVGNDDGIGLAFSGTEINDSQVDWHKTVLWPELTKSLTGVDVNTKILGIAKTHHWGLALPVAFKNKKIFRNKS